MIIKIPNLNNVEMSIENKKSIVLIGANGSGKTRMGVWIASNNPNVPTHRISAQKSLNMPESSSPSELSAAAEKLYYGGTNENKQWLQNQGRNTSRWGSKPETHLLNDYKELMEYLMTENYQKSIEYREKHLGGCDSFTNETKLEQVKKIWENVITHRKIKISAGKIEVSSISTAVDAPPVPACECEEPPACAVVQEVEPVPEEAHEVENLYNGSEMSDGERAIFYFIGEILCAQSNSLIIIDEPENHLHKSILVRLWDAIEIARPDCTYVYITHSLEFASSRIDTQIVWVKNMIDSSTWEYELVDNESVYSVDNLLLEILGSRQKILLVEGRPEKSTDKKLYIKIFPEYNILPLESCHAVIQATKAYNRITDIHYSEVKGIIDRDRRSDDEIADNRGVNLFAPEVAEIENLFMLPDVIRIICEKQNKKDSAEQIVASTKTKTIEFLRDNLEQQTLLFTRQRCQNDILRQVNKKADNLDEYKANLSAIGTISNADEIYTATKKELQQIVDDADFIAALKVINNKGLLPHTKLSDVFGWKKQYYIDFILDLLGADDAIANSLREAFRVYIQID